ATGTAMMKMISITSITSTRGVVLMSDIGVSPPPPVEIAIVLRPISKLYQAVRGAGIPHVGTRPAAVRSRPGGRGRRLGSGRSGRRSLARLLGRGLGDDRRLHRAARGDVGEDVGREAVE